MSSPSERCRFARVAAGAVVLSCGASNLALAFSTGPASQRRPTSFGASSIGVSSGRRHPHRLHHRAGAPSSASTYSTNLFHPLGVDGKTKNPPLPLSMTSDSAVDSKFEKMSEDDDQVIAFMDASMTRGIDCYVDSYATVDGVEYTIGSPCDYAVALCYFEGEDEQLVPIELDDPLMDDIFPVAEGIIEEEFGEELVLLRTPQTLTLVGELEENELKDEEDDDESEEDDEGDLDETEEEVEILVSFEEDGREYHLVRLLDPVLLVGKTGAENTRILLTPEESDTVMPKLEAMFMSYQEERDGMLD
ncbi:hypothetical protein ACHAW5_002512 [Stephanodiscus triporus]|uniref:Uncharacterized protein n=1 Tax=Stephanodiscus triporus TaxID=2934178 RepID=A0ABD3QA65_9STRA